MTFKCPFKDQLAALDQVDGPGDEEASGAGGAPSGSKSGLGGASTGKYLPP